MHELVTEKAKELGRVVGQSEEYKALKRARQQIEEARELRDKLDRLQSVAEQLERSATQGNEPAEDQVEQYESLLGEIQSDSRYQHLVAAQTNFDKLMVKVNEHIAEGMRKGSESPIITLG